jgi:hypothetical protein
VGVTPLQPVSSVSFKVALGQAFTVSLRTEKLNQADMYPCAPRVVSVRTESTLGHPRYDLVDVPPQPNSPTDSVSLHTTRGALMVHARVRGARNPEAARLWCARVTPMS